MVNPRRVSCQTIFSHWANFESLKVGLDNFPAFRPYNIVFIDIHLTCLPLPQSFKACLFGAASIHPLMSSRWTPPVPFGMLLFALVTVARPISPFRIQFPFTWVFFFLFLYSSRRSALGASHNALFIIHLANTISSCTHYKSHNKIIQELKTRGKLQGIAVPERHNLGPGTEMRHTCSVFCHRFYRETNMQTEGELFALSVNSRLVGSVQDLWSMPVVAWILESYWSESAQMGWGVKDQS